jgi:hypothetical protein
MQIRTQDGQVMYEAEFRTHIKANGGPSWDTTTTEVLTALGADVVFEGAQATGGTVYQYSHRAGVEQIDGKWYTKYVLGPTFTDTESFGDIPAKTAAENEAEYKVMRDTEQASNVRRTRDAKLAECDWTQVADAPVDKTVWATYRQALRDITAQEGFPWTVTYPDKP